MIQTNNNKQFNLKAKLGNTIMISGEKKTGEKILLKFAKRLQKSTPKNFKNVVQSAIVNATPTFKINEQIIKKGKRKAIKITPSFIANDSLRLMNSLKFLKETASRGQKAAKFYESLANEVLTSSTSKSQTIERKTELQKQVLANKRYLSKFRW